MLHGRILRLFCNTFFSVNVGVFPMYTLLNEGYFLTAWDELVLHNAVHCLWSSFQSVIGTTNSLIEEFYKRCCLPFLVLLYSPNVLLVNVLFSMVFGASHQTKIWVCSISSFSIHLFRYLSVIAPPYAIMPLQLCVFLHTLCISNPFVSAYVCPYNISPVWTLSVSRIDTMCRPQNANHIPIAPMHYLW